MPEATSLFGQIAFLLILAAGIGYVGFLLRQPLIVSFIAVGIVAGPSVLDVVHATDSVDLLAELGIAVLLFLVGSKLDVGLVRSLGRTAVLTGLGQVLFTSVFGLFIGVALGFSWIESAYIAVALTFSSTIIIVKLLSDKREIDSLHGRIALGFLIVQDLVVVLAMIVLATLGAGADAAATESDLSTTILNVLGSGLLMLLLVALLVRYVATPLTNRVARVPELLVSLALGLAASFAALGERVGLGMEIGGLLAGVVLASTPYRESIAARMAPLRDFLLLFFFIGLGAELELPGLADHAGAAIVFSLFVLVGNPLIVLVIMARMGYHRRTGFLAGLTVAQISEFSLLFTAMGVALGHLDPSVLGLVTLVGLVTIAVSTYMIMYSHLLYAWCEPVLGRLVSGPLQGRVKPDVSDGAGIDAEVVVFGMGRFGTAIAERLARRGIRVLGADFDPQVLHSPATEGIGVVYGDAGDPEFVSTLPLAGARWVVCTLPALATGIAGEDVRRSLLQALGTLGYRGRIALTSHDEAEARDLATLYPPVGVDLVFLPFEDAADRAVEMLCSARSAVAAPATRPLLPAH